MGVQKIISPSLRRKGLGFPWRQLSNLLIQPKTFDWPKTDRKGRISLGPCFKHSWEQARGTYTDVWDLDNKKLVDVHPEKKLNPLDLSQVEYSKLVAPY